MIACRAIDCLCSIVVVNRIALGVVGEAWSPGYARMRGLPRCQAMCLPEVCDVQVGA